MSTGRVDSGWPVAVAIVPVVDVGLGVWAGTQWVAHRLAYSTALGPSRYFVSVGEVRRWMVGAVVLTGAAAVLLLLRGWRRASPVLIIVSLLCAWVARRWPIYTPWSIIIWHWRFRHELHLVAIVQQGWEIAAVAIGACVVAQIPLLSTSGAIPRTPSSQGTAAWDMGGDLVGTRGLLIGWQDRVTRGRE